MFTASGSPWGLPVGLTTISKNVTSGLFRLTRPCQRVSRLVVHEMDLHPAEGADHAERLRSSLPCPKLVFYSNRDHQQKACWTQICCHLYL